MISRRWKITSAITSVLAATLLVAVAGAGAGAVGGSEQSSGAEDTHINHHGSDGDKLTARQIRKLASPLAKARAATAKYATDPELAKADGYRMTITQMIPDMGHHFLNPDITGFDVTKPPILVYVRNGAEWQLVAFEWVFTEKPDTRPLPGATYGSFGAACHYEDGTFVFEEDESACSESSPESGALFSFWHPELVTLHLWAWYPNPAGIYSGTNRWVRPYNDEQI